MTELTPSGELGKVISDIAEVAQYMWEKGWAARNAGNVSVDVTELVPEKDRNLEQLSKMPMVLQTLPELAGRYFLVSTTGSRFRDLARELPINWMVITCSGVAKDRKADRPPNSFLI